MEKRTILFKGKRVDNGEWVFGNLVRYKGLQQEFTTAIQVLNENKEVVSVRNVRPETVCQYIGRDDKNGVKIFENDFDQNYDVVKWCEKRIGYSLFTYDHTTKEFIHCNCYCCNGNFELNEELDKFEVIGNVHNEK